VNTRRSRWAIAKSARGALGGRGCHDYHNYVGDDADAVRVNYGSHDLCGEFAIIADRLSTLEFSRQYPLVSDARPWRYVFPCRRGLFIHGLPLRLALFVCSVLECYRFGRTEQRTPLTCVNRDIKRGPHCGGPEVRLNAVATHRGENGHSVGIV
jgi:hypothetical protein